MIEVGDIVEVRFKEDPETMVGEVVDIKGHKNLIFVINSSKSLENYQGRMITVDTSPEFGLSKVKKVSINSDTYNEKEKLLMLIDLAIDNKDKEWFMELTERLKKSDY